MRKISLVLFLAVQTMDLPFGLNIPNCEVWNEGFEFDRSETAIL